MLDFITRFFKREEASKATAKERLRLVLMSDRVSLAPDTFDEMKGEMLAVIRRYLEIDEHALDLHFENLERQFALLASIPVLKVKTRDQVVASNGTVHAASNGTAHSAPSNGSVRTPSTRRRRRRRRSTSSAAQQDPPADAQPPSDPML